MKYLVGVGGCVCPVATSGLASQLERKKGTQNKKGGIVPGGTELPAIWPSEFAEPYTIVSLEEASLQYFAGSMPATGGSLPPPDPC
jgi:hypothetical protein